MPKRRSKRSKSPIKRELEDLKIPHGLPGPGHAIPVSVLPDNILGITTIDVEEMKALNIVLKGGRTKAETHETLIHEILHCVEAEARRQGVLEESLPEEVIEFFAGGLLILLAGSGLHAAVSQEEAMDYVEGLQSKKQKGGWSGEVEPSDE